MLNLPKSTEINRILSKKTIFSMLNPDIAQRQRFDADISRMAIVNEVSKTTVNIAAGENIQAFFVVCLYLRRQHCDDKNLLLLAKLIPQHMLFALSYGEQLRLAAVRSGKVIASGWLPQSAAVMFKGLNMDSVWENIIVQIGNIVVAEGSTLDEQLAEDERQQKLLRRIEQLEQQARRETQPRRKYDLTREIAALRKELT